MSQAIEISDRLIAKYAGNLPRYTSYPTAPHFHSQFGELEYLEVARQSNEALLPRALSVYIHIPFCHSLCYFCGCNKVIAAPGASKVETYLDALMKEIRLRAELFDDDRLVQQIHFGGGTPNFLSTSQLNEILEEIARSFHLDLPSKLEVGIELDPRHTSAEGVRELSRAGFNRFSIGVQDFSKPVQVAINRIQNKNDTLEVIEAACGVSSSVNLDLITGLPNQNYVSMQATLETVIKSGVSRIAAYGFAYLPELIRPQRLIDAKQLPSDAQRVELGQQVSAMLQESGYQHIGMDHYSLESDSLYQALQNGTLQRNFQGYTTHAQTDLVGLGVSAISSFTNAFAQNDTSVADYIHSLDERKLPIVKGIKLTADDELRQLLIQRVMCSGELNLNENVNTLINGLGNMTVGHYFNDILPRFVEFEKDGILEATNTGYTLTKVGRFFMRCVAACLDANLPDITKGQQNVAQFSRAL